MNGSASASSGFTLVELLITMVLAAFMLFAASQLIQSTNKVSQNSVSTSNGIEHVQQASNIIADDVRRAVSIVAPGQSPYVGVGTPGVPSTTGAQLLVLTAYALPGSRCSGVTPYEYVAYYFTKHSNMVVSNEYVTVASDTANANKLTLVQFSSCADNPDPSTSTYTNDLVRVVADYLSDDATLTRFDYSSIKNRNIQLSVTPSQVVAGKTVTGKSIRTTALARNIY